MNKYIYIFCILSFAFTCNKEGKKILFIGTNVNTFNNLENGTYLTELAQPFDFFTKKGFQVDIVSSKGGEIPTYFKSEIGEELQDIIDSEVYKQKTSNSLSPKNVNYRDYCAVIIPGGYGQFKDVHKDDKLLKLIAKIYQKGGAIGTIGHGISTLIHVNLKNGTPIVKDKKLVCFPSWYEKNRMTDSNYGELLPYDMEVKLKSLGADLRIYNHETKENYEMVDYDNRIVTASFATGGDFVAKEIFNLIGKK